MQADDVSGVDIELRDLRLAVVTSQHRSLRQAAEALNIRQSTLSRRLHEIERQLGVVLFERTNGGTRLTMVGLEFIASAKRILDDVDPLIRIDPPRLLLAPIWRPTEHVLPELTNPHLRH
jgi:DNA-binding transcriptional LysR family regulator